MVTAALSVPTIPAAFRFAMNEELFGEAKAYTQADLVPTYLIEINLRDQWDFGHVFCPPGLATEQNLIRGEDGNKCCLYYMPEQITAAGNNMYLTPDSIALQPHLDSIAVCETHELCIGAIHGHEAVNAMRSPGRSKTQSGAKQPMWMLEPGFDEQGQRLLLLDHADPRVAAQLGAKADRSHGPQRYHDEVHRALPHGVPLRGDQERGRADPDSKACSS